LLFIAVIWMDVIQYMYWFLFKKDHSIYLKNYLEVIIMKIHYKLFLKSGIAILLLFIIVCGLISCSNHKKDELTVGYIPISECAQLYVAIEMGYFEKEGLDV